MRVWVRAEGGAGQGARLGSFLGGLRGVLVRRLDRRGRKEQGEGGRKDRDRDKEEPGEGGPK